MEMGLDPERLFEGSVISMVESLRLGQGRNGGMRDLRDTRDNVMLT